VVARDSALGGLGEKSTQNTLGQVASRNFVTIREGATLFAVAEQMRAHVASVALVADQITEVKAAQVKGIISRQQIGEVLAQAAELFGDL
jgi:CBS domain-containing protein